MARRSPSKPAGAAADEPAVREAERLAALAGGEAPIDCRLCPRLTAFRDDTNTTHPTWFNGAVPSFGDATKARLLIVGLAPGLQGANKTGRPFTGDYAGDLLYATLDKFGFSQGTYDRRPDDGLTLRDCMITNAVRCVPPANKPTTDEIKTCRPFLSARLTSLPKLKFVLVLGRVAHDQTLTTLQQRKSDYPFAHGARHEIDGDDCGRSALVMFDSFHCSRYNTNTGRLTEQMFHDVFAQIRSEVDHGVD